MSLNQILDFVAEFTSYKISPLENADVEGNGDSSKAKRDEVVTPRPIIGILSQVNQK